MVAVGQEKFVPIAVVVNRITYLPAAENCNSGLTELALVLLIKACVVPAVPQPSGSNLVTVQLYVSPWQRPAGEVLVIAVLPVVQADLLLIVKEAWGGLRTQIVWVMLSRPQRSLKMYSLIV